MSALVANLLVFGRLLRALGLEVHVGRLHDIAQALPHVNIGARDDVYHTCRALLVHRREDLAMFDRAFDAFWRVHADGRPRAHQQPAGDAHTDPQRPTADGSLGLAAVAVDAAEDDAPSGALQTWSDAATLAHKDFAEFSPDEIALARAALDRLEWTPGERRTRRWVRGRGPRVDLRRALAQSVRTGGDVFVLPRRRRRMRVRPVVLLCDISGSMERYSRMLLHFAHAIGRRHRQVEAFVFSTQLTRVTTQLRARTLDGAVLRSGEARRLAAVSKDTREVFRETGRLMRKDREQMVYGPIDLLKTILAEGEKGLSLQRYKGLGEMNPEQLWETTLDPEARTLLQVKVDDLVEADDIFTKLMGDVVEPRREFIQQNALNVEHLDT